MDRPEASRRWRADRPGDAARRSRAVRRGLNTSAPRAATRSRHLPRARARAARATTPHSPRRRGAPAIADGRGVLDLAGRKPILSTTRPRPARRPRSRRAPRPPAAAPARQGDELVRTSEWGDRRPASLTRVAERGSARRPSHPSSPCSPTRTTVRRKLGSTSPALRRAADHGARTRRYSRPPGAVPGRAVKRGALRADLDHRTACRRQAAPLGLNAKRADGRCRP